MGHSKFFFCVPIEDIDVAERDDPVVAAAAAMSQANEFLESQGFVGTGYFSSGMCDYFGYHYEWMFDYFLDEGRYDSFLKNQYALERNCPVTTERNQRLAILFKEQFPEHEWMAIKWLKDSQSPLLCAAVITKQIYNKILKPMIGEFECFYCAEDPTEENLIDKFFVVCFDYHT